MSRRRIGQEQFGFAVDRGQHSSLGALDKLIDWMPVDQALGLISCATKGEPAYPPMALFKAMLQLIWYDLSDVKLAEGWTTEDHSDGSAGFLLGSRHLI